MPHLRGRRSETHFIRCQHLLNCDEHIPCLRLKEAWKRPIAETPEAGNPVPYPHLRPSCIDTGMLIGARESIRDLSDWRGRVETPTAALPALSMKEALRVESRTVCEC